MQEIIIGQEQSGQRFDKFLHRYLPGAPNSLLYKMLRKKNITLNGMKAEGRELLHNGDVVWMYFAEETFLKFRGQSDTQADSQITEQYYKAYKSIHDISVNMRTNIF